MERELRQASRPSQGTQLIWPVGDTALTYQGHWLPLKLMFCATGSSAVRRCQTSRPEQLSPSCLKSSQASRVQGLDLIVAGVVKQKTRSSRTTIAVSPLWFEDLACGLSEPEAGNQTGITRMSNNWQGKFSRLCRRTSWWITVLQEGSA